MAALGNLLAGRFERQQRNQVLTARHAQGFERRQLALLLVDRERCLVQRRPLNGLLGGLWEFPSLEAETGGPLNAIRQYVAGSKEISAVRLLGHARHAYSHFRAEVDFYRIDLEPCERVAEGAEQWLPLDDLDQLPLHGAHKKLLPLIGA